MKKISPDALISLKKALSSIYWYKKDIKEFIKNSINDRNVINKIDWSKAKYQSISDLIDYLSCDEKYNVDLLNLFKNTINISDFSHLKYLEDSEIKISKAKDTVNALKKNYSSFFKEEEKLKSREKAKKNYQQKIKDTQEYHKELEYLRNKFNNLFTLTNHQQRGFKLESFLNELFHFFDLSPKSPYKIKGEQIDGAFSLSGTDFIIEAKWQKEKINLSNLYLFNGKVESKLKTTLGLYISINGYSENINNDINIPTKSLILMDGMDLINVLDGRITLNELISLKKRHASETGNIMHRISL